MPIKQEDETTAPETHTIDDEEFDMIERVDASSKSQTAPSDPGVARSRDGDESDDSDMDEPSESTTLSDAHTTQRKASAPSPQAKTKHSQERVSLLAIMIDTTGSMGSYIRAALATCTSLVGDLKQLYGDDTKLKVAVVAYRDHGVCEQYETKVLPFEEDSERVVAFLSELTASGGRDVPECVATALHECNQLDWMCDMDVATGQPPPKVSRSLVWITDAPAHGLGDAPDNYPNGDFNGHDPLILADELAQKNVTIHCLGCEPSISKYPNGKSMMNGIADRTNGVSVALNSANDLSSIISGNVCRKAQMDDIQDQAVEMIQRLTTEDNLDRDEAIDVAFRSIETQLLAAKKTIAQVDCAKMEGAHASEFATYRSLSAAMDAVRERPVATITKKTPAWDYMPSPMCYYDKDSHGVTSDAFYDDDSGGIVSPVYRSLGATVHDTAHRTKFAMRSMSSDSLATAEPTPKTMRSCVAPPPTPILGAGNAPGVKIVQQKFDRSVFDMIMSGV